jgi:hypothetical protein
MNFKIFYLKNLEKRLLIFGIFNFFFSQNLGK